MALPEQINLRPEERLAPSLRILIYGVGTALMVFAVVFYKLRVFSDTAFVLVDMARKGGFTVAHSRAIIVLTQLLPAALYNLHAPMQWIVLSYSVNYTLVSVGLALLCLHWLKRPFHAIALLLLTVIMSVLLFYYAVSEMQIALLVLLFYDALCDEADAGRKRVPFIIATIFVLPFITLGHPMMLLVMGGWIVYRLLVNRSGYKEVTFSAIVVFATLAAKKLWLTSTYEAGKMLTWEAIRPFGLNFYSGPFALSIYDYIVEDAFMMLAVLAATIGMLVWLRHYKFLGLLVIMIIGIFTLVLINFEDWKSHVYDQYYEHHLQSIMFFIVLIFCFALARVRVKQSLIAGVLAVVFCVCLVKIGNGSEPQYSRQRWMQGYLDLMDSLHAKKAVLGRIQVRKGMVMGSFYSSSAESLILSAMEGPEHSKTMFMAWDVNDIREPVNATDQMLNDSWTYKQSELPERYFQLGNKSYIILDKVVPDSTLQRLYWR